MHPAPAEPASPPRASLEYDRAATSVTRRQFRFLFALTLLNTILLATFVCGPAASQYVRKQWQEFQTRRQVRAQIRQQDALLGQAGSYAAPADQVVYEENPQDALKLLGSSQDFVAAPRSPFDDYKRGLFPDPNQLPQPPWQVPVLRKNPSIATQLQASLPFKDSGASATVLLHHLKNSRGEQRLVWVVTSGHQQLNYHEPFSGSDVQREAEINTTRGLTALIIQRKTAGQPVPSLDPGDYREHLIAETPGRTARITWTLKDTWSSALVRVEAKGQFRFYAAQLDPANPSHFTIDCAVDGQRSTIDGFLDDDDTIRFVPRSGQIVRKTGSASIWHPLASPAASQ